MLTNIAKPIYSGILLSIATRIAGIFNDPTALPKTVASVINKLSFVDSYWY